MLMLLGCSASGMDQLVVKNDTIPEGMILVPRKAVDKANAESELCDYLREQMPSVQTLSDLYKQGYQLAVKVDTIQEHRNQVNNEIIIITNENYKAIKKQLYRNKIGDIYRKIERPFIIISSVAFGIYFSQTYIKR